VVELVILIVVALVVVAALIRLVWSFSRGLLRGDLQIEPTSYGRQLFGRRDKPEKPE
jgi:O-antigen/teichoic acid export membrane protein